MSRMRQEWQVLVVVGLVLVGFVCFCTALIIAPTSPSGEKGYAASPTEQPVRMLIAQEQTVEAQLADRSILVAQQRATVLEACDLIAALDRPSTDVATWSASHCVKGEK